MTTEADLLATERQFFAALIAGNVEALDQILADDFLIIDVMTGSEATKPLMLAVIASGQLKFDIIEPVESRIRLYQNTAVVTGRTHMAGRFEGLQKLNFSLNSRYTHVYVEQQSQWRLVSAQGTQITQE